MITGTNRYKKVSYSLFSLYDRRTLIDRDQMNESGLKGMTTDVDAESAVEDFASIDSSC